MRVDGVVFVGDFVAPGSSVAALVPTMVLSETRAGGAAYGLIGLSEGAYGGP